ncbi:hypothetical protein J4H92_01880 [Leucobacter weissii]|uniref:Transcriptional regulator, AbiEi antitoxin, Type IV TA system n=1 Tax=Leucobacter weissii TaxID=1983706 RepID=A0A939MI65_9MICO|nr:hypothetical protein [Leucobacter weissii]MBO1900695.1 hypothetical protein [Leucobacter weissii]
MDGKGRLGELRSKLQHRHQLAAVGRAPAELRRAVKRGELLRILRGWYVAGSQWHALSFEDQHRIRALAVHANAIGRPVFSHHTAATLQSLPLLRFAGERVHLIAANTRSTPRRTRSDTKEEVLPPTRVSRHRSPILKSEIAETTGLRHTDLIRTVLDVARSSSFDAGLVCADAGMRTLINTRRIGIEEARRVMLARLEELPRSAGKDRARRVTAFASPLVESPLETLCRLQLARLGIAVREQVEVVGSRGTSYRVDIELLGHRTFLEADGRNKYLDPKLRDGRTAEEVVLAEKRREDEIRAVTQFRMIRCRWNDSTTSGAMLDFLRGAGIDPPRPDGSARPDLY